MAKRAATKPLTQEPAVGELLSLLEQHNAPGQQDLLAMLGQIAGMEKQLAAAVEELAAMRKELAEARESPVKRTLTSAVKSLEKNMAALRERLGQLKTAVIDGCKKTLEAFKEQGVSALAHTAQFFHIRPALEAMGRELDKSIAHDEKALSVIASASKEYHETGLHLKNFVRAVGGREPVAEPKGPGALARTLEAPFKAERSLFIAMKSHAEGALGRLTHLEQAAERPSIRKTMEEMSEKAAKAQQGHKKAAPAVRRDER